MARLCRSKRHDLDVVGRDKGSGTCRECRRIYERAYYSARTAIRAAKFRRYYLKHKEQVIARTKAYELEHPERYRQWKREYYRRNRGVMFWVQQAKESV